MAVETITADNGDTLLLAELDEHALTYLASFAHDREVRREAWRLLNVKYPVDPPVAAALRLLCGGAAGVEEIRTNRA